MKYPIKFTLFLLFTLFFSLTIRAQNPEWVRIQSDNGEFSVEMPKNPTYFYDKDGFYYSAYPGGTSQQFAEMQMLNSAEGKTMMSVEVYKAVLPEQLLDILLTAENSKASKIKDLPKGFAGKQSEKSKARDYTNKKDVEVSYVSRLIASKTHLYVVTVANRGTKTPEFERFLASITLSGNQTGNTKISELPAITIKDVATDASDSPKSTASINKKDTPKEPPPDPTPLLVLTKPKATYTDAALKAPTSGTIRLRVTFEKNGRISKIAFVSGLENGLNRTAFFAALRIKFIPHEKDGILETVSKPVEYSFSTG